MELLQKPIPGILKRYWRRRRYQRLYGGEAIKNGRRWRRSRKIKAMPKLRWRARAVMALPMKLLAKLRNGYMKMMLRIAGNTEKEFGGKRKVALGYSNSEFDQRLLREIYKNLIPALELYG